MREQAETGAQESQGCQAEVGGPRAQGREGQGQEANIHLCQVLRAGLAKLSLLAVHPPPLAHLSLALEL